MSQSNELQCIQDVCENLVQFFQIAGRLKTVYRSIEIAKDKKESVAEHSWRVALLVMMVAPKLDKKIDLERAMKMALIHDLAESVVGDTNIITLLKNEQLTQEKFVQEQEVFVQLRALLGDDSGQEILQLWQEFEENQTYEAKTVNAMDKLEAQLQQNESKLSTWEEIAKTGKLDQLESLFEFDSFVWNMKETAKKHRTSSNENV